MDDYISREGLISKFKQLGLGDHSLIEKIFAEGVYAVIDTFPAADVEPVKHWIPVSERLPDLIPCSAGTAYSEAVNVWTTGRKVMVGVWDGIDWIAPFDCWEAWGEEVTHWMPLPEPPEMGGNVENG